MTQFLQCSVLLLLVLAGTTGSAQTPAEANVEITNQGSGQTKYIVAGKSNVRLEVKGRQTYVRGRVSTILTDKIVVGMDTVALDDIEAIVGVGGRKGVIDTHEGKEWYIMWGISVVGILVGLAFIFGGGGVLGIIEALIILSAFYCVPVFFVGLPFVIYYFMRLQTRITLPNPWRISKRKG